MYLSHQQSSGGLHGLYANVQPTRGTQFIENSMAIAGTGQIPASVSRGYAILVDATGREHPMLLDQCRYLDQLEHMLLASLYQCRPDEAEIQRWYIDRKQYDFVIYGNTDSDVTQLTRESDIWSKIEPGTKIVTRAIIEEKASRNMMGTYMCQCGTPNTINVSRKNLSAALERGCTITCRHCERRFQVARTRRQRGVALDDTDNQQAVGTPTAEAKYLIRNFLAKQVVRCACFHVCSDSPRADPPCAASSFQRLVRVFVYAAIPQGLTLPVLHPLFSLNINKHPAEATFLHCQILCRIRTT
ncbi:hypothetical protein L210DRAFT_2033542 [Boletus edulis BED1]|uniref:Uncharacterized protein n=1 Tax=Boletus edulis BED1 TaxID=1328754 RepID=A0AAD4GN67_BOLED|nr:hypothetical protein L210DRAFT_2033542 [Boletus edulis BED1]